MRRSAVPRWPTRCEYRRNEAEMNIIRQCGAREAKTYDKHLDLPMFIKGNHARRGDGTHEHSRTEEIVAYTASNLFRRYEGP